MFKNQNVQELCIFKLHGLNSPNISLLKIDRQYYRDFRVLNDCFQTCHKMDIPLKKLQMVKNVKRKKERKGKNRKKREKQKEKRKIDVVILIL